MLRVTFAKGPDHTIVMRLEGRLVSNFAEVVRIALTRRKLRRRVLVELSDLTSVDEAGEGLLLWLGQMGAEFVAESSYARCLCDRLQLPIAAQPVGSS
ncbi:MAG TPA: hypothetical protein VMT53_00960 [Terriglobales bacterium]|nr:hypothetical protein [Terriglobales bacterium]